MRFFGSFKYLQASCHSRQALCSTRTKQDWLEFSQFLEIQLCKTRKMQIIHQQESWSYTLAGLYWPKQTVTLLKNSSKTLYLKTKSDSPKSLELKIRVFFFSKKWIFGGKMEFEKVYFFGLDVTAGIIRLPIKSDHRWIVTVQYCYWRTQIFNAMRKQGKLYILRIYKYNF